jgi:hypothetical protein
LRRSSRDMLLDILASFQSEGKTIVCIIAPHCRRHFCVSLKSQAKGRRQVMSRAPVFSSDWLTFTDIFVVVRRSGVSLWYMRLPVRYHAEHLGLPAGNNAPAVILPLCPIYMLVIVCTFKTSQSKCVLCD